MVFVRLRVELLLSLTQVAAGLCLDKQLVAV